VKKLLEENRLGKILSFQVNCYWNRPAQYYSGDWRGTTELDGGLLYTQFSHFIDLLYWFLGDVETVAGLRRNNHLRAHLETEDSGVATLQLRSGAIGSIHYSINSFDKNAEGSLTLLGARGMVKIGGQYLNTIELLHTADGVTYEGANEGHPNDYGFYSGSMSNHHKVYEDLLRALDGQPNSLPLIAEAAKSVEIIERIYANTTAI
jgi:predicted dehydrogenase